MNGYSKGAIGILNIFMVLDLTIWLRLAILNSAFLFIYSVFGILIGIQNNSFLIFALFIFSSISIISSLGMMIKGGVFIPIAWFTLGSGILFGVGNISWVMNPQLQSSAVWNGGPEYIFYCVLIDSLFSFSTLCFSSIILTTWGPKINRTKTVYKNLYGNLYSYIFIFISLMGFVLKIISFPNPESLLLRSILDKLNFIIPSCFVFFGLIFRQAGSNKNILTLTILFLWIFLGLIEASKFNFLLPAISFSLGYLHNGRINLKSLLITFMFLMFMYLIGTSVIGYMRGLRNYIPESNTVNERVNLLFITLKDYVLFSGKKISLINSSSLKSSYQVNDYVETTDVNYISESNFSSKNIIQKGSLRFMTGGIQTFLIFRYNMNNGGSTIKNLWVIFVPRIFWKEKPIITAGGQALNNEFYSGQSGSLAPTYPAEAYWNYGYYGVVSVSAIFGLILGILSFLSMKFTFEKFTPYLLIAVPAIIYSFWIEGWIGPSIVGGGINIFLILFIFSGLYYLMRKLCKNYNDNFKKVLNND